MSSSAPTSPLPHTTKKRRLDDVENKLNASSTFAVATSASKYTHDQPSASASVRDLSFILGAIEGTDAPILREYVISQIRGVIAKMRRHEVGAAAGSGGISGEGVEAIMDLEMREDVLVAPAASHPHNLESIPLTLDPSASPSRATLRHSSSRPNPLTLLSTAYADRSAGSRGSASSYITSHVSIPASTIISTSATDTSVPTSATPPTLSDPTTSQLASALIRIFKDFPPDPTASGTTVSTQPTPQVDPAALAMSITVPAPKPKRSSRSTSAPPVSSPPQRLAAPARLVPPSPPREDDEELHCTRCHVDFYMSSRRSSAPSCVIEHDWEKLERKEGGARIWRYRCCGYEFESSTGGNEPTDPSANSDAGMYCFVGRHTTDSGPEVGKNMNTYTCDELGCWEEE
ncbi:hypothetical protein FRB98_004561 [Tulasnella sp. 332]|nr:hypothetical protein FRB98_004561 [Tulasnella sp. 332]